MFVRCIVICYFGVGVFLVVVFDGCSIDTTMGFIFLEGLVMAICSGSVDLGLLFWLLGRSELTETQISAALEYDSGLVALVGTPDMTEVIACLERGDERAQLAFDVYIHCFCVVIVVMVVLFGGFDVVAFIGGVGEYFVLVWVVVVDGFEFFGFVIDCC